MIRAGWKHGLVLCAALLLLSGGGQAGGEGEPMPRAVVCPVDREISDGVAVLVRRAVQEEAPGAAALVFVIDTFGGRVDSAIEITEHILDAPCPTIAFITGKGAISAGALIAYACDYIVMAPGTNIGASTPFMPAAEAADQVNEKSMSFLRAKYRALGEMKGHNPLLGEAMVDEDIELFGIPEEGREMLIVKVRGGKVEEGIRKVTERKPGSALDVVFDALDEEGNKGLQDLKELVKRTMGEKPAKTGEEAPAKDGDAESPGSPAPLGADLPATARMVSEAGKLLTLTSREALELGLADAILNSPEEALVRYDLRTLPPERVTMRWDEALFTFLTSPLIAGLLLMCGVAGIYLEFKTPGLGWAGFIGAMCLAIYFGSRFVVGMADWMDVALVLAGFALLAAEIFVIPGFGLAGAGGIVCLLLGVYLSLTRVTIPEYSWDFMRLTDAGVSIMVAAGTFLLFMLFMWKVFPSTPLARGLVQSHAQLAGAGYVVQTHADAEAALGMTGVAVSMLRPAGRGRFGGRTLDVMTRGEFVEPGRRIVVIQVEGNRYVVREQEESQNGNGQ